MAITSQLRATAAFGETWLEHWKIAGLLKPSAVKPVLFTIERPADLRVLGTLDESDQAALRGSLARIVG